MPFNHLPLETSRGVGRVWRFAGREFDEARLELRVNGQRVEPELKPLEVLVQLLNHAGEVVSKDHLLDAVWPGLNVVDGSLTTAVHKLRKALGDDSSEIVVTVPRVGYRLAAVVQSEVAGFTRAVAAMDLECGQSVPGRESWRLVRRLSTSRHSDVWLAEHPKTSELRVFKFCSDTAGALKALKREVMVSRFFRESLGDRPEFVRIHEWNFDTPPYFLESEYGGLDLTEWAERQGGLSNIPMDRRLSLLAEIARIVAVAHEAGVLHRDLKPANVLILSSDGGTQERIRVADFGSGFLLEPSRLKALGITSLGSTQTTDHLTQSLTGTFLYLAPEVLSGSVATAAADVYSLGIILYQLVIGDFRKPLSSGWERVVEDPLIREYIATAVSGDPAWRFATAAELAHRLCGLEDRRCIENSLSDKEQNRQKGSGRSPLNTSRRRPWIVLASLAAILMAAVFHFHVQSSEPKPLLNTVAILPFQNVGSDHALDFLSQAVPDEIATSLSYARSLAVRSSVESGKYTQPGLDLQYVGNQLKAASIITGHFIQETNDLRFTIEAIDVKTGRVFWRDTFTVPARSMIEMRQALTDRTQGTLGAALGASALTSDIGTHPTNEEAYYLYLRAAAVPMDTAVNKETISMLEKSVGLDPDFSSSWLMLGRRYYLEGRYANGGISMMRHFQMSIERALALDPNNIAAAANLTVLHLEQGELTKALREGEDLVRRRPNSADAHHILGAVFRYAGLLEDSSRECELAFRLDPHTQTAGLRSCAIVFSLRGKYDRAKDYLNLDPNSDFHKAILLTTLLREGRTREALQVGTPKIPQWRSYDMLPTCEQNRSTSGLQSAAANLQVSEDPEANYLAAANLAFCGLTDQAMLLLKRAVEGNYCSYPALDSDPFLASLRMMPQFAAIRKTGLACQQNFIAARRGIEGQRH